MSSLILRTASRFLLPLLLLFSIFLLLRGHNQPGGGFVGGLVAASAMVLYAISYGVNTARGVLILEPHMLIGSGLLIAGGSGMVALFAGEPYMAGRWTEPTLPLLGKTAIGTPLIFDVGVYLVVLGITLLIIFTLAEE